MTDLALQLWGSICKRYRLIVPYSDIQNLLCSEIQTFLSKAFFLKVHKACKEWNKAGSTLRTAGRALENRGGVNTV